MIASLPRTPGFARPHLLEEGHGLLPFGKAGFGTYRLQKKRGEAVSALETALHAGIQVIDTAPFYGRGEAEGLVGSALRKAFVTGQRTRESVFILGRCGVMQNGSWGTIRSEVAGSLTRLGLETLDCVLLQAPERVLAEAEDHRTAYEQMIDAFEGLEHLRQEGLIRSFGISSSAVLLPPDDRYFLSIDALIEKAEERGVREGFRALSFPVNLYEPEALFLGNQLGLSVFEAAEKYHLWSFLQRPLLARLSLERGPETLIRMTTAQVKQAAESAELAATELQNILGIESTCPRGPWEEAGIPMRALQWGHWIQSEQGFLSDPGAWRECLEDTLIPLLNDTGKKAGALPGLAEWYANYVQSLARFLTAWTQASEAASLLRGTRIESTLRKASPTLQERKAGVPLSTLVLQVLQSLPAKSTLLVGMRTPAQVESTRASALTREDLLPLEEVLSVFEAIQEDLEGAPFSTPIPQKAQ